MIYRVLIATAVLALTIASGAAMARERWTPSDDTITAVTGTRGSGFQVEHYRQRTEYLPTLSEAMAECGEYHDQVSRVRCRVSVRTWYRGLGETKRAIWLAQQR